MSLSFTLYIVYDLIRFFYGYLTTKQLFKLKIFKLKKDKLNLSQRPSNLNKFLDSILLKHEKLIKEMRNEKQTGECSNSQAISSHDVIKMMKNFSINNENCNEETKNISPIIEDLPKENEEKKIVKNVDKIKENNNKESIMKENFIIEDKTQSLAISPKLSLKEKKKSNIEKGILKAKEDINLDMQGDKGAINEKSIRVEKDKESKVAIEMQNIEKILTQEEKRNKEVKRDSEEIKENEKSQNNTEDMNEDKGKAYGEYEDIYENEKKANKKQIFYIPYKGRTTNRQKYYDHKDQKPNVIFVKKQHNKVEDAPVESQDQEEEMDDTLPRGIQELLQDEEEKKSDITNRTNELSESNPTVSKMNIPYNFINIQDDVDKNELDIFLKFHENFDEKKFCSIKKFWEKTSSPISEKDHSSFVSKSAVKDSKNELIRERMLKQIEKELELDYSPYDSNNHYPEISQQIREGPERYPEFLRKSYKL